MPARIWIAIRKNSGEGECRNCVPGRKAPDAADEAAGMASEPGVGEISVQWNLIGSYAAIDVFHDTSQNLGTQHRFTRQQKRMLIVRILS